MSINVSHDAQLSIASIVFATDFSSASRNAGLYAAAIARHFNAKLIIIHAFILSQSAREAESLSRIDSAERRHLKTQLQSTAASLVVSGESVRTELLDGEPSEKIAAFADAIPRSLLVLGTHGGGSVERHLIGSVAERSLRRAACPTITVGPNVPELSRTQISRECFMRPTAPRWQLERHHWHVRWQGHFQARSRSSASSMTGVGPRPTSWLILNFIRNKRSHRSWMDSATISQKHER